MSQSNFITQTQDHGNQLEPSVWQGLLKSLQPVVLVTHKFKNLNGLQIRFLGIYVPSKLGNPYHHLVGLWRTLAGVELK